MTSSYLIPFTLAPRIILTEGGIGPGDTLDDIEDVLRNWELFSEADAYTCRFDDLTTEQP